MENKQDWIELNVEGLDYVSKSRTLKKIFGKEDDKYKLILSKKDESNKKLTMVIGKFEGESIAIILEEMIPSRPLIQDLFKSAVDKFEFILDFILINKIDEDGYFYSLMFYSKDKKIIELDARPADAIALALRHKSTIYIDKSIFENYSSA